MNKKQSVLRTIIIVLVISKIVLSNLFFLLEKIDGYWLIFSVLLEVVCFIWLFIAVVLLIIRTIRYSQWRNKINYFIFGIALVFLCAGWFFPPVRIINENTFQSPVKIRACYGEIMSRLYFRENGTFDSSSSSFFGYNAVKGTYIQKNDTLFLDFLKGESRLLGDTLVIKDSVLYKVQNDTLVFTFYYLGECRR